MNGLRIATPLAAAAVAALAARGGDGDDAGLASAAAPTTVAPTAVTPTTAIPTTAAPPTTTDEDLKAVIARDVEESTEELFAGLVAPTLESLPALRRVAVAPGSPAEAKFEPYVRELIRVGDGIIPGEPDILKITVENVELVGAPPYTRAWVTVCEVENRPRAKLATNSPSGQAVPVPGTDELVAIRELFDVRLVAAGWRVWHVQQDAGRVFLGVDECLPA